MKRHLAFVLALAGAVAVGRMLSSSSEPTRTITTTTTTASALDEAALRTMIRGTIRDELRSHELHAPEHVAEPAPVAEIEEAAERPEHAQARTRAERLVTAAIAAGVWHESDFDAFDAATRELSGSEKVEAMRPLAVALNAQRVKIVR